MAGSTVKINFSDVTGEGATMGLHFATIVDPTSLGSLISALDGVTIAAINGIKVVAQDHTPEDADAEEGPYDTSQDKAAFSFLNSGGGPVTIEIPAPTDDIFLTDGETVDPSNDDVIEFLAQVDASVRDPNGGALTFVGGRRVKTYSKKA
jgi:hypothetical protein